MRTDTSPLVAGPRVAPSPPAAAQDVMKHGLSHWTVLAENEQARVLRFAPEKGVKTPFHSHPSTVLYVVKGGRVRITMLDGSTQEKEYKPGAAFVRAAETHSDEAVDAVELILVELKN